MFNMNIIQRLFTRKLDHADNKFLDRMRSYGTAFLLTKVKEETDTNLVKLLKIELKRRGVTC